MLKLIEGSSASKFPVEMDAMFRNRAQIFSERLGWNVSVKHGRERDEFDDTNPLYLISVDPKTRRYRGSLRLLPTTGPNMLRDVFPFMLDVGEFVESATIWEVSRICAVPAGGQLERTRNGLSPVLGELVVGVVEVGLMGGLTQIVSVFDAPIYRMLKAAGCNPQLIGRPRRIEETISYVGLFDTGNSPLEAIRRAVGIEGSVLEPEARELEAA